MRMILLISSLIASGHLFAQGSLCNPCVDPGVGAPRPDFTPSIGQDQVVTGSDLRSLGVVRVADMLRQLQNGTPPAESRSGPEVGRPIVHETVLAAPLESAWHAWTTSAGLSTWLAPLVDVDLRIGGNMRVSYDANAALDSDAAVVNEILAYDPQRMLAFRVAQAPRDFAFADAVASMWTVVYLDAVSADATRVRVVVNGLAEDAAGRAARAFFESGNANTLRRLEQRFGIPQ